MIALTHHRGETAVANQPEGHRTIPRSWKRLNAQVQMKRATFCVVRTSTFQIKILITSSEPMAGISILPIHSMFRSRVR
jgi:hypothetical protein